MKVTISKVTRTDDGTIFLDTPEQNLLRYKGAFEFHAGQEYEVTGEWKQGKKRKYFDVNQILGYDKGGGDVVPPSSPPPPPTRSIVSLQGYDFLETKGIDFENWVALHKNDTVGQRKSIERQVCVKECVQLWGEYLDLADVLSRAEVLYQWIQDGGIPEKGQFPATWEEYQARSHLEEVVKDMGGVEVPATDSEGAEAETPRLKDSTPEELPAFKTVGEFGNYCLKHSKKGALDKFLKDMGLKSVQEIKDIKAAAKVVLG